MNLQIGRLFISLFVFFIFCLFALIIDSSLRIGLLLFFLLTGLILIAFKQNVGQFLYDRQISLNKSKKKTLEIFVNQSKIMGINLIIISVLYLVINIMFLAN